VRLLWMGSTQRLWTVPVHMYDQRRDTPKNRRKSSVEPGGNTLWIGGDHSAPHHDGLDAGGERLLDRATAQFGEHLVMGDAMRVGLAEDLFEPGPEVGQSHSASVPPATGSLRS